MSSARLVADATEASASELARLRRENRALRAMSGILTAAGLSTGAWLYVAGSTDPAPATLGNSAELAATPGFLPAAGSLQEAAHPTAAAVEDWTLGFEIPEFFDTRMEWIGCGTYVVDQRQCGDCYAASAANVLGDRACIHLQANGEPVPLRQHGAHGAGTIERMFQQAGVCVGLGSMADLHQHGCKRNSFFVNPQALVSCGNVNNTEPPTYHPYPDGSGYKLGHTLYPSSTGCNGGEAQDAWRFFYHEGLTTMDASEDEGCTTYTSGTCAGEDPLNNGCRPCEFSQCADTGLKPERVRVDTFGWIMEEGLSDRGSWDESEAFASKGTDSFRPESQRAAMDRQVRKMQIEMMTNGPLHTCIDDYANFGLFYNQYPQAIYNSTEGSPNTGGHCIELMGWGTDQATGMPYWTWKNSWGTNFANGGYARFIRGVDLLGIESDVWAGCPSGSLCRLTDGVVHNETWVPKHAWFPVPPGFPVTTTTSTPYPYAGSATNAMGSTPKPALSSAARPSRSWPGGKEVALNRKAFSHHLVAPAVVAAVRHALGDEDLDRTTALATVRRVWSRSVRGLRVRVEVKNVDRHATATRHMEGHITAGWHR